MENFRSDKAWKARKDFLALKTREIFRVLFREQYRTRVGYEQLADEGCLRAYEEATVIKERRPRGRESIEGREEKRASCKQPHPIPKQRARKWLSSGAAGKTRLVFQTGTTPGRTRGEGKAEERDTAAPTAAAAAAEDADGL